MKKGDRVFVHIPPNPPVRHVAFREWATVKTTPRPGSSGISLRNDKGRVYSVGRAFVHPGPPAPEDAKRTD
jgi:hypothetical protein